MIEAAQRDIDWLRTGWHWAPWVRPRGTPIAVMGHSYGAIQAARIAIGWSEVGALAAFGGPFLEPNDAPQMFANIRCPSLFMFSGSPHAYQEQIESDNPSPSNFWRTIPGDHYAAIYQGEHFDYLEPSQSGTAPRGPCSQIGELAAELAALFVSRVLRPLTFVSTSLRKPQVSLTEKQWQLAVAYMKAIDRPWGDACRIHLKWKVGGSQDNRWIG
jgi:pimeloyl-ACP methyl ester carboxylesterase